MGNKVEFLVFIFSFGGSFLGMLCFVDDGDEGMELWRLWTGPGSGFGNLGEALPRRFELGGLPPSFCSQITDRISVPLIQI